MQNGRQSYLANTLLARSSSLELAQAGLTPIS